MKVRGVVRDLVIENSLVMYIFARVHVTYPMIVVTVRWRRIDVVLAERNDTKFCVGSNKYQRAVILAGNC